MWSSRTTLRFADSAARRFSADPQSLQNDNQTLTRRVSDLATDIKNYALQTNLTAKLKTGFVGHEFLFGFDGNITRFNSDFRQASLASINIFNPVYGAAPGTFSANAPQKRAIDFYGFQIQDLISFGEHWKVLLGGRLDHATTQFERNGKLVNDATDKEISPRVGVVFQPVKDLSLYASYVESFDPFVFQINSNGDPYKPEFGEQIEVGVKRDWLQGRLSTTLSMFQLTRQNVLTADPNDSNSSIQTGEQRSRGIELDVSGEILAGWKIFGSFTYMDSEITKDNTFQVGNNLQNVPVLSGSLWSDYTIQNGFLRGLKLGGGVFVVGRREGDLNNSFEAPGYARVDARVSYKIHENLNASLNINNLFDKYYIEAPIGSTQLYPGEPLTVLGRLQLTF
jgi:iron complex outermembrane receptor protein